MNRHCQPADEDLLICINCHNEIVVGSDYDGYYGRCSCTRYYFTVGGGDLPAMWKKQDEALSLSEFIVTIDRTYAEDGLSVTITDIECRKCGDGTELSATIESLEDTVFPYQLQLTCENEHYRAGIQLSDCVYYTDEDPELTALREYIAEEV